MTEAKAWPTREEDGCQLDSDQEREEKIIKVGNTGIEREDCHE